MSWEDILKQETNMVDDVRMILLEERQPIAGQKDSGASGYNLLEQLKWNPSLPAGEFIGKIRSILIEGLSKKGYSEAPNYVNSLNEDDLYQLAGIPK